MVDGKLSNIPAAQLLKQIPSSAIKAIELITNPSAKYNPDGMSGIINMSSIKIKWLGLMALWTRTEGEFNWESQTVQLGFNYRFGSSKFQAKSRRQRDRDEKNNGGGMF